MVTPSRDCWSQLVITLCPVRLLRWFHPDRDLSRPTVGRSGIEVSTSWSLGLSDPWQAHEPEPLGATDVVLTLGFQVPVLRALAAPFGAIWCDQEVFAVRNFFKVVSAGPMFFVSAWVLMIFAGIARTDVGIHPFGYVTSMVVTIGLWLTLAPAIGAVARVPIRKSKHR